MGYEAFARLNSCLFDWKNVGWRWKAANRLTIHSLTKAKRQVHKNNQSQIYKQQNTMGNAKSMNRAEIEEAAASGKWDNNVEILSVVQDVQAKKKRRKSKKERPMEMNEIDEIYDLVLSLKNGGREGEDLLNRFVHQQTKRASITTKSTTSRPPVRSIMIDTSSTSHKSTRAQAA